MHTTLDAEVTAHHRAAWDEMMAGFVPGLAGLEATVCTVAETHRPPRRILDLGGGPGVLAERMAGRWPGASVTVLDLDPVLLALARAGGVTAVGADLAAPGWTGRAGGGHDLVTAVMTLHYLTAVQATHVYRDAYRLLAPGGLLVVADLMPDDGLPALMRALDPAPGEAAAELAWAQWWDGLPAVLGELMTERTALFRDRLPADFTASVAWHTDAARAAGFAEAGVIWRSGRHAALAAVR